MKNNELEKHGIGYELITEKCIYCRCSRVFIKPLECYCNVDFDGAGYSHMDEYGACSFCKNEMYCSECMGEQEIKEEHETKHTR